MGLLTALIGFGTVMAAITWYFMTIAVEKVPKSVTPFGLVLISGSVLSVAGALMDPSAASTGLAAVAAGMGGFVLYLLPLRTLPDGALTATLDQPMPALIATDQDGASFDLSSLRGQRVMVKFFRGSW